MNCGIPSKHNRQIRKKNCQSIIMKYKLINLKLILSTTFVWSHFSSWFMVTIFFNFSLTCNIFIWIHFWLIRKFKTRNPSKLSLLNNVCIHFRPFLTYFQAWKKSSKCVKVSSYEKVKIWLRNADLHSIWRSFSKHSIQITKWNPRKYDVQHDEFF